MLIHRVASLLDRIIRGRILFAQRKALPSVQRAACNQGSVALQRIRYAGLLCWVACLGVWLGFGLRAGAQPANDDFSNAANLTGRYGSVTGYNFGATKEPGEPFHAGDFGGASVWFSWEAPTNGTFVFDTVGSSFDTLLAVYTGTSVAALSLVVSDDDIESGFVQSAVQFVASAGTTYKIAVDGYGGEEGSFVLSWDEVALGRAIISSGPLTNIAVGSDGSFQVYHANFMSGQLYPPGSAPADAGFFVRQDNGTVDGINWLTRDTAASGTRSRPFHPISQSLSQNGLEATMVMDNRNDGTSNRFQVTQVTRYRPGDEYFVVENTVLNQGASPFTADMFAAGDLFLADSDFGYGFEHSISGVVGGIDFDGAYHIFIQDQPGNPAPVLFQEDFYATIWEAIGTPGQQFANTIRTDYIDNGVGLEWPNVTLAPGASVKIAYSWAFGALSDLAVTLTSAPDPVAVGGQITYQAAVTNVGGVSVTHVVLTDELPGGVSFISASSSSGSCMNQGGKILCNLGVLGSNQTALVTIRLQPTAAGMITNKVAVSGNQADIDLSNNTAAIQVTALGDASPVISIRAVGPNVVLSWQPICASCVLQQVERLNPPIMWTPVGAPVMAINGTNQVTLPRGTTNCFFRLGPGL